MHLTETHYYIPPIVSAIKQYTNRVPAEVRVVDRSAGFGFDSAELRRIRNDLFLVLRDVSIELTSAAIVQRTNGSASGDNHSVPRDNRSVPRDNRWSSESIRCILREGRSGEVMAWASTNNPSHPPTAAQHPDIVQTPASPYARRSQYDANTQPQPIELPAHSEPRNFSITEHHSLPSGLQTPNKNSFRLLRNCYAIGSTAREEIGYLLYKNKELHLRYYRYYFYARGASTSSGRGARLIVRQCTSTRDRALARRQTFSRAPETSAAESAASAPAASGALLPTSLLPAPQTILVLGRALSPIRLSTLSRVSTRDIDVSVPRLQCPPGTES